jgi:molybdate transport system regulatory protein
MCEHIASGVAARGVRAALSWVRSRAVACRRPPMSISKKKIAASIHLRAQLAPGVAFGPGKADLLEGIRETGSIAAAGRRMRMSYKRAWQLVEELNHLFREPLVEAAKGGAGGGGARLTRMGDNVLACYTRMRASATEAVAADLSTLCRYLP